MVQTVVTFSQRGGYLFECTSKRFCDRLPEPVIQLLREKKITNTYCLALGKGDSFVIAYQGSDGMQHLHSNNIPDTLREWLHQKDDQGVPARELDQLKIAFGPYNDSHFATDGKHLHWANVPEALKKAIAENRHPDGTWKPSCCPRLVALGASGNYIMITEGNGGSWILDKYTGLKECIDLLKEKPSGFSVIANITMNPYRMLNYALEARNGLIIFENNMPHSSKDADLFTTALKEDVEQEELKKQREQAETEAAKLRLAALQAEVAQRNAELRRIQQQQQLQQLSNGVRNAMIINNLVNMFAFANLN